MIRIVDYGLGNILAFQNMYKRMNIQAGVAKTAADLEGATRIVLPGVGAFDEAMDLLEKSGMRPRLTELVKDHRVPTIGICVGMQILAQSSDEGRKPGLGWIDGEVKHFKALGGPELPVPHMGWNDVQPGGAGQKLFAGLEKDARFYFLHSFYFRCHSAADVAATSLYGTDFACAVHRENIYGVQFHPEKSHHFGARLLKNFAEI
jgi:imidazole glycerol-phosphate synthase subunit HisH